jgi:hypothetical protein
MLDRSIKIPWADEAREMAEKETAEQKTKASSNQFIPKLSGAEDHHQTQTGLAHHWHPARI